VQRFGAAVWVLSKDKVRVPSVGAKQEYRSGGLAVGLVLGAVWVLG
jgi:hypothetical protein